MLVKYNGADVFTDQLDPLVSKTVSFPSCGDNRLMVEETITLVGELAGCNLAALIAARNSVNSSLSTSFKTLQIGGMSFSNVKIESINFDESPYLASLPYNITFLHYPDGGYEFGFGITDPKNSYTYTENTDGTLSISQEISAKGINTTSSSPGNGLENATAFVQDQLDLGDPPRPATIDTAGSDFGMCVVEFSEEIDKLNKIVTINRTFETDMSAAEGAVILRYTSEITEEEGEELVTTYNGTVDACRNGSMSAARSKYKEFKGGLLGLGAVINENVTEDPNINNISFSFSFVDGPEMVDDFTITLEENSDSSLFSVSINGNISTRGRCMSAANFASIEAEYNNSSEGHLFDVCQSLYADFYSSARGSQKSNPGVTLNSNVIAKSIALNEHDQSASYSASYNDRQALYGMHSFDFTVTITPSLFPVKAVPSAYTNGWIFQDLGYRSRATISTQMTARGCGDALGRSSFVNLAQTQFGEFAGGASDIYVTMNQYTVNNQDVASATYAKSFHSSASFTNNSDYITIQAF